MTFHLQSCNSNALLQIAMKCLSILRYLTDHVESLELGVTSRLVITHDVPELLVRCLETRPWIRRGKRGDRVFQGSDWQVKEDIPM